MHSVAVFLELWVRDYDRAESLYRTLIDLDPDNSLGFESYALFLKTIKRNYDEAESLFERARKADPNNSHVWYAKIPSGSHLTEMLTLVFSASLR
jgi:tetratricopeptide (TPR) repeat protein